MKKYSFLTLMVGAALLPVFQADAAEKDTRPNFMIILADDLGYADVGFTGATEIKTPELDSLAENGVVCNNGYVTHAYCGPSRAGLLTGRYQARFGMEINATYSPFDRHMGLPVDEKTFGERLQTAGYRTGIIGKWHVGAASPFHPNNRGFDHFYGFLAGGHSYWPDSVSTSKSLLREDGTPDYGVNEGCDLPLERNGKAGEYNEYLTTALSRDAAQFVNEGDKPFCLYLAYNAPHSPLEAPEETVAKYSHVKNPRRQTYLAMIDEMDKGIGMVIDALEESDKLDNTIIFFMSDNGGVASPPWSPYEDWADNGPFRRGKTSMFEGGSHVPYFVHWPDGLKKGTFDGLVSSLDFAATAVELAGGDTSGNPMDGVNIIPFLQGEKKGSPHKALFWRERGGGLWAVRTPETKYVMESWGDPIRGLFDMVNDPFEKNNIIDENPELRAEMAKLWNDWNAGNKENVLLHAYDYQKRRLQMYDDLYKECVEKAENTKPVVVD